MEPAIAMTFDFSTLYLVFALDAETTLGGVIMKMVAALLALLILPTMSQGHSHELCEGFVPKNDLKIPVNYMWSTQQTGITEAEFQSVIDKFESLYAEDFKAKGAIMKVNRLWTDATVNASAEQSGNTWVINMYGGLARHPAITRDGFALALCHEAGHHLGGAPKYKGWFGDEWASNEGQSDYFAGLKCLRRLFKDEMKGYRVRRTADNQVVVDTCRAQHASVLDQRICVRASMAGMSVARLFQALRKETVAPSFLTPDPKVVLKTNDNHPATQCRLDTYWAGAACSVAEAESLSDSDYSTGTCTTEAGATAGVRPLCWFKPTKREEGSAAGNTGVQEWSGRTSPSEEAHKTYY